ncbi:MAG TPA: hypothetical protein VGS20_11735 [Candidatus Acidoferrales bacterium]|nr:hypothetical protein [Candidatus Acidoferrales bacterium]
MKRNTAILLVALLLGLGGAALGIARAQQAAPKAAGAQPAACPCMQAGMAGSGQMRRMMGQGMMGMQAGGMGMQAGMMGMRPMMVPGAKVEVKSIENGAVITVTSADAKAARRIQIMAEMMRLMHELRSEQ